MGRTWSISQLSRSFSKNYIQISSLSLIEVFILQSSYRYLYQLTLLQFVTEPQDEMLIFELPGLRGFSRRVPVVGYITAEPLVAPVFRCCLSLIVIMQHQPKPETLLIRLTTSFLWQFFILIAVSHNFLTLLVMSRPSCKMSSSGCIDKYFQRTKLIILVGSRLITRLSPIATSRQLLMMECKVGG